MVGVACAALVWLGVRYTSGRRTDALAPAPTKRFAITLPRGATLTLGRGASIILSSDGRRLVYVATLRDTVQLFQRILDQPDSVPIPGTDGASDPFFSPDDRWIGFFAGGKLKKIRVDGGAPITLASIEAPRGATWAGDDSIILAPRGNTGLWRIPAGGGKLEAFTTLADLELSHRWPQVTPDGKFVIYTVWITQWETAQIAVAPIGGGPRRVILTGAGHGRYVDVNGRGYLFYTRSDQTELAVPVDRTTLAPTGPPRVVVADVVANLSGGAHVAVSASGAFAYVPGMEASAERELVWVDRGGRHPRRVFAA